MLSWPWLVLSWPWLALSWPDLLSGGYRWWSLPMGQAWQAFKAESCSHWPTLPSGWPSGIPSFRLGPHPCSRHCWEKSKMTPVLHPSQGYFKPIFFFLSPCRKPVLVVQNGSKSASCFKGARRLHLNTQSLPPGHPYTVAGLGFIKTMPESSFQAPGGEPRCRELRKGKTWFFQDRFSHIKDSRKRRISFNSYLFLKEQSLFKISHDV